MSVIIKDIEKGTVAYKTRIKPGDTLVSINGNIIMDVLDYRFYQNNEKLIIEIINAKGKIKKITLEFFFLFELIEKEDKLELISTKQ